MISLKWMVVASAFTLSAFADEPKPYPTLNPPPDVTPVKSRGRLPWSPPLRTDPNPDAPGRYPRQTWTAQERAAYEQRIDWFHKAKFGLIFHYLAFGKGVAGFPSSGFDWTPEKWDEWVDAVDVEKVADQAKELGVGYVMLTLGQNHRYSCAPNPVLEELWELEPGEYTSRRDLPMDLAKALEKRGIPMMLYISADNQYRFRSPKTFERGDRFRNWVKVCQWYSDHYGKHCKGWWVDGLADYVPGYAGDLHAALKHGNPDAIVSSSIYELSDFMRGHCIERFTRQKQVKPYYGRWDPDFKFQWHQMQYLGNTWARSGSALLTASLVDYTRDVVRGGGVITFDVGMYKYVDGQRLGPFLEIPPNQFEQLKAVRDAVKDIPASDGSGR